MPRLLPLLLLLTPTLPAQNYTINTVAGWSGNSYVARIGNGPTNVALDTSGNVYVAGGDGSLYKLTPQLVPSRIARTPYITDFTADGAGNLYVLSPDGIRKVAPTGLTSFRPIPDLGYSGGLAIDAFGTLYISNSAQNTIYRLPLGATAPQLVAGTPGNLASSSGDGGPALAAHLYQPGPLAIDAIGALYVAEGGGARIRRISPTGIISTVVGTGVQGHSGDGGPATRANIYPTSLAADQNGNLYFSEAPIYNVIRKVDRNGIISTIVGAPNGFMSAAGDNVPAVNQQIQWPKGIAVDQTGNVFFADSSAGRVYKIDTAGILHTIFGMLGGALWGDGGPAILAGLTNPSSIAADGSGNIFFADNLRIRKVDPQGIITTYADPEVLKPYAFPFHLALDSAGNLYVTTAAGIRKIATDGSVSLFSSVVAQIAFDSSGQAYLATSNTVSVLQPEGTLKTVAGTGATGYTGDGGPAILATFNGINSIAIDRSGNLFISDALNFCVRRVGTDGIVKTVAGNGSTQQQNVLKDYWVPATSVQMFPSSIAVDPAGNLFINSVVNLFEVVPSGLLIRIAGDGKQGYTGDGGDSSGAEFVAAGYLASDPQGNLFRTDGQANAIRVLRALGPPTSIGVIFNAASRLRSSAVTPGELIAIAGLGLAGATVTFNDISAPVLSTSQNEILAQVPEQLTPGQPAQLVLHYNGTDAPPYPLTIATSAFGFFTAAVNQDGTVNSATHPAQSGSLISLYATGLGTLSNPTIRIGPAVADVLYLGQAPSLPSGVTQINVRVPDGLTGAVPVTTDASLSSLTVTLQ